MQTENIIISHHDRTIYGTYYKPDAEGHFPLVIFSHGYNGHQDDFAVSAKYFTDNGIGASQGGMVSALTAEERASDIHALILLYPALCIADDWNARFPTAEDIPDSETLWGMELGRRFFESIRGFQIKEKIGQFTGNVLLMHGSDDAVVNADYSVWASKQYPNARLEIFQSEGHGFSNEGNRRMEAMALYFIHECMNIRKPL